MESRIQDSLGFSYMGRMDGLLGKNWIRKGKEIFLIINPILETNYMQTSHFSLKILLSYYFSLKNTSFPRIIKQ